MILPFTLIVVALAILLLLLYVEGGRNSSVNGVEDLAGRTRPVDLEAFRNLVDAGEEDFLRANLSRREFRAVQRERTRAALEYVRNSAHNAACLLRLGEAASRSGDPRIAQAGRQLIDSALRLRAYALLSNTRLYVRLVFPESRLSYGQLADKYQNLSALASQLALMQYPDPGVPLFRPCFKDGAGNAACSENPNSTAHRTLEVLDRGFFRKRNKRDKSIYRLDNSL